MSLRCRHLGRIGVRVLSISTSSDLRVKVDELLVLMENCQILILIYRTALHFPPLLTRDFS